MKTNYKLLSLFAISLFSANTFGQITVAQWNFNGESADAVAGGATSPTPSIGAGTAEILSVVTPSFDTGNTTDGTLETETETPPNYAWTTTNYASAGDDNETHGVQFNISTVNYTGVTFRFEQRLSNKSANTWVVEYTLDRTADAPVWVEAETFTFIPTTTSGDSWYNDRSVSLVDVIGADNNPNLAFRIVAAFDPTAGDYVASKSTSTYDPTGKVRFDMVTLYATTALLGTPSFEASQKFSLYPNPSNHGLVNLSQPENIAVFDMLGKVILKSANAAVIDTSNFDAGIYIVKTDNGISSKLIIE
jgi:hypothetical protein